MGAPPQARGNRAARAERDAKIFNLKIAGVPERAIAAEVGISQARVNEIIRAETVRQVGPLAEAYADQREAELIGLHREAWRSMIRATSTGDRLKAIETLRKINESRRRLRGADAPEALSIALDARVEVDAELTARAITTVLERLQLPPDRLAYALEVAGAVLEGGELPAPMSSGMGAAPYVDGGALFVDGPPGSGLRYRVVATETQPGERADVPALMPAPAADADEDATELLDVIDAEFADLLED